MAFSNPDRPRAKRPLFAKAKAMRPKRATSLDASAALARELEVQREELAVQNEELRRANTALGTARERYAQLYDGAPIAYFTLDDNGLIIEANIAGAELLEASRNFLFGRSFDHVVVPSSRDAFRRFRRHVIDQGSRPMHETILMLAGRHLPVRIEAARIAIAGVDAGARGEATHASVHLLLCVSDKTEERRLDETRRGAEKLSFHAGPIAHDINDSLTIVLANVDLILTEKPALAQKLVDRLHEIREATLRAAHLAKRIEQQKQEQEPSAPNPPPDNQISVLPSAHRPTNDIWRGSGLVLVVDDEDEVRDVIGRVLEHIGFDVCFARDGAGAIAEVTAHRLSHAAPPIVAVLLDLITPFMSPRHSGAQTLVQLKQIDPKLPVIMMSGRADVASDDKLMALADGFVSKPFTLANLATVMQHAVTGRRALQN